MSLILSNPLLSTLPTCPTLQQLLRELSSLDNWFIFGAILGVPVSKLKQIELEHHGDIWRCKIDMLQYWLDGHAITVPDWDEIVRALENIDQLTLAAEIKQKYLWWLTKDEGTVAVHRRDTDVEEREERISQLEKELEEMRREGAERESLLSKEIKDLKSKLVKKTDNLNQATKRNSELSSDVLDATHQLKDKDAKIDQLEAQIKFFEDTVASLRKNMVKVVELTELLNKKPSEMVVSEPVQTYSDILATGRAADLGKRAYQQKSLSTAPKMKELLNKVASEAKDKWNIVGIQLDITQDQLNTIKHSNPIDCYSEVFKLWKNKGTPPFTWATILEAMRSPAVEEDALANDVETWLLEGHDNSEQQFDQSVTNSSKRRKRGD